jgi:hypothetical protein
LWFGWHASAVSLPQTLLVGYKEQKKIAFVLKVNPIGNLSSVNTAYEADFASLSTPLEKYFFKTFASLLINRTSIKMYQSLFLDVIFYSLTFNANTKEQTTTHNSIKKFLYKG